MTAPARDLDPVLIALTSLIPGGMPESMTVVITETTSDGATHTWSGSLNGLSEHVRDAAPGTVLSDTEKAFLKFALDLAFDEMVSNDGFTEDDEAALASLRKLAGEKS